MKKAARFRVQGTRYRELPEFCSVLYPVPCTLYLVPEFFWILTTGYYLLNALFLFPDPPTAEDLTLETQVALGSYIIVDLKTGFLGKDGWSLPQRFCE